LRHSLKIAREYEPKFRILRNAAAVAAAFSG
jgi:hypothetical protein